MKDSFKMIKRMVLEDGFIQMVGIMKDIGQMDKDMAMENLFQMELFNKGIGKIIYF